MTIARTRREFLLAAGRGLASLAVVGAGGVLSPRVARAAGVKTSILTPAEVRTLEALGDTLLPGAAAAGIAPYVDRQLGSKAPLLMLRYLDFPMPPVAFYRSGLAAIDAAARSRGAASFPALAPAARDALVAAVATGKVDAWSGPPAPLCYFTLRADAVDVCYGTLEGFARLGIPYLPHIAPKARW